MESVAFAGRARPTALGVLRRITDAGVGAKRSSMSGQWTSAVRSTCRKDQDNVAHICCVKTPMLVEWRMTVVVLMITVVFFVFQWVVSMTTMAVTSTIAMADGGSDKDGT